MERRAGFWNESSMTPLKTLRLNYPGKPSQADFAKMLGGEPEWYAQRVERLENGKTKLDLDTAKHIATALKVDIGKVLGAPVYEQLTSETAHIGEPAQGDNVRVPEYSALISAGYGANAGTPEVVRIFNLPRDFVRQMTSATSKNLALVPVIGDSMMPDLRPDDLILVDLSSKGGLSGDMYVILDGDCLMVKELDINPPNVTLISRNPAYQPTKTRLADLEIIGRVVGKWGKI